MCTFLQSEQCHSTDPLNLSSTSPGIFSHFMWYEMWHVSHSAIFKCGFLLWYQTHGILHIQNTSTVEIFSGEKRVTVFVCFSGNGSKRPSSKHWRKCALILILINFYVLHVGSTWDIKCIRNCVNTAIHNIGLLLTRANVYL